MKEILKDPVLIFLALSVVISCTSLGGATITALVNIVTSVLIIMKDGVKPFRRRSLLLYMAFVIIVFVYSAFGKGNLSDSTFKMLSFSFISIVSVFMMSFHLKTLNIKQIKGLLSVAFIALLLSIIGTTVVSFIEPWALRMYGFGHINGVADLDLSSRYYSMGMMSYPLAHAMSVVAISLSVLFLRARSKSIKILSVVLLVLIIRILFVMTITTTLLLTVIGVSIVFANYFSHGRTFIATSITILIATIFFLSGFAVTFLDFSEGINEHITVKLGDFFNYAQTGSTVGQVGTRGSLYMTSLKTFLSNPIFGFGSDNGSRVYIGEHSYLFDYLAYYGLFALLLFISWWKEFISLKSLLSKNLRNYYYIAFIPFVALLFLKAVTVFGSLPFMLLVFTQIVFLYLENQIKISKYG